jgi:hypothetical protein
MVDEITKNTSKLGNQKGQALFEMILFLPFLLFLYTIYYTVGNSLSGSINQQKAVRGYYYAFVKGNSYVLSRNDLAFYKNNGMKIVGFSAIGWTDHLGSAKEAFGPCFKFSSLLKNNSNEECESPERDEAGSSRFIRLYTYYGVCGPTYTVSKSDTYVIEPGVQGMSGLSTCVIGK